MTWATSLAPILSREPSSRRFDLHFVGLGTIIPLSIYTNSHYNTAIDTASALLKTLGAANNAFEQDNLVEVVQLTPELQQLGAIAESQLKEMVVWWRAVWIAYSGLDGILVIVRFLLTSPSPAPP